jgi:D-alanyl-lipoteichoic acid acyltransferase DltB (MBOAT superfamily)
MLFTTVNYAAFLAIVFAAYWLARGRRLQNALIVGASYVFYGWVHPWFCALVVVVTLADYFAALGMRRYPRSARRFLVLAAVANLGLLASFKFFSRHVHVALAAMGLDPGEAAAAVLLPVGISFYSLQGLGYVIDCYRGDVEPRRDLLDFAVFVSFFAQLVAGPIERAQSLLPQIERPRRWDPQRLRAGVALLVTGCLKKMVVADNIAVHVDRIFMLENPTVLLLVVGTMGFAVQILADFSAYTDLARGSASLLGFDLVENFRSPYLAVSPSDFWRRWHVSFSTWIRDYVYIPLGGSRVGSAWRFGGVLMATMGLAGLWHGADWNFLVWGFYGAAVLFIYHRLGMGGRWCPRTPAGVAAARAVMIPLTLFGWLLFRSHSLTWLAGALAHARWGWGGEFGQATVLVAGLVVFYSLPVIALRLLDRFAPGPGWARSAFYGGAISLTLLLARLGENDFIYFKF